MYLADGKHVEKVRRNRALHHYEDHTAFFYGKISATAASLVTYFMTAEFIFLATTIGMLAVMLADVGNIRTHRRLVDAEDANFEAWEYQYTFLSTAFMLIMGIWCFFCFTLSKDLFVHLLCIAITMGNVLNLICRNFSDDRILTLQLVAVAFPLVLGILAYGDIRSMILCAFFLPLFSSVRDVSGRLRELFTNIEIQSSEKEAFGTQLNEALESMSHGLIMFDDDMRLKIINQTALDILGIDPSINCYSKTLNEIAHTIDSHKVSLNRVQILEDALMSRLRHRVKDKVFKLSETQHIELSIKLREEGGCVLVIEDVSQRIQYQTRINQLAKFDELTGLCNRSFFQERTRKILQGMNETDKGAVLFFDLDDFKKINDTHGHEAGDFILTSVAERLKSMLPDDAIAGRYGGDEFVVFMRAQNFPADISRLADDVVKTITRDMVLNHQQLRFGISLGIATYPKDGTSIDRLLKLADLALYDAKHAGKNTHKFFTSELEEVLEQRLMLEDELANAIRGNKLDLHFQPIVRMDNGKVQVFEALTRWNRSDNSIVPPSVFIPIAEDLGLIREIGEWTLVEACRQCSTWPENIHVAVNLSAVQFQVGSVTQAIKHALDITGLDPSRLEIEITETAVLNDMNHAVSVLETLNQMGVRISLDDFGTGYSSLSYLHKLPLQKLKIDKAFVDDLENSKRSRTLLKGITVLGKAMDLKIVVEGVETEEQFKLLKEQYDVDFVQGFYFSKALPSKEARAYATSSSASPGIPATTEEAAVA